MITASYTAGVLVRSRIRDFLKEEKFRGSKIEWIENKGFLESTFLIRGEPQQVNPVCEAIDRWAALDATPE